MLNVHFILANTSIAWYSMIELLYKFLKKGLDKNLEDDSIKEPDVAQGSVPNMAQDLAPDAVQEPIPDAIQGSTPGINASIDKKDATIISTRHQR